MSEWSLKSLETRFSSPEEDCWLKRRTILAEQNSLTVGLISMLLEKKRTS